MFRSLFTVDRYGNETTQFTLVPSIKDQVPLFTLDGNANERESPSWVKSNVQVSLYSGQIWKRNETVHSRSKNQRSSLSLHQTAMQPYKQSILGLKAMFRFLFTPDIYRNETKESIQDPKSKFKALLTRRRKKA